MIEGKTRHVVLWKSNGKKTKQCNVNIFQIFSVQEQESLLPWSYRPRNHYSRILASETKKNSFFSIPKLAPLGEPMRFMDLQ